MVASGLFILLGIMISGVIFRPNIIIIGNCITAFGNKWVLQLTNYEVSARDLAEYIDRLIDLMPARQRQVFNMSRREHKSYREIAEELNLSQKTVEAHMHEALRFLRDNLALLLWLALFNDGPVC